jgi:hypothetical protein
MASWFKTRRQANKERDRRVATNVVSQDEVFRWTHTKRKKPFFVGSYFEWMNV